ncbi:RNA polymerase sigma factor [Caenispirillum salinarum]|uniref:RNA polymerase sigma factor n=1 Tax=Caenispirillum salinarum TaxID=859058 RepID=UPI0005B81FA6|nr:RNA polymerase sigma factor [Caenispirillum salinarum]
MPDRDVRALFLAHRRELEVYLTRQVSCRDTAADLLQETFVRLVQQPPTADLSNVRAYLYRIARNLVIDHFRRHGRRQTVIMPVEDLHAIADEAVPIDQALDAEQRLMLLRQAIADLPERTRQIFTLNRIDGLTYAEVAEFLGISESSVQKHLAKALLHAMRRIEAPCD